MRSRKQVRSGSISSAAAPSSTAATNSHGIDHHRTLLDLAAGQVGGRRQLVGDGEHGGLHLATGSVGLAAQVERPSMPADPIATFTIRSATGGRRSR